MFFSRVFQSFPNSPSFLSRWCIGRCNPQSLLSFIFCKHSPLAIKRYIKGYFEEEILRWQIVVAYSGYCDKYVLPTMDNLTRYLLPTVDNVTNMCCLPWIMWQIFVAYRGYSDKYLLSTVDTVTRRRKAVSTSEHFEIAWQRKIDRPAKDILYFYIL